MEGALATLWNLKIATGYHREDDEQQYREPKEPAIVKIIYYVTAFFGHNIFSELVNKLSSKRDNDQHD